MRVFLDTSIFVDVLRARPVESSVSLLRSLQDDGEGFTSSITVAELTAGACRSPRKDALKRTLDLLSIVSVVPLTRDIAVEGGKIYAGLVKKGREIELNDCLIAATSISVGVKTIVTRDVEHFSRIDEIKAVTPEDLGF